MEPDRTTLAIARVETALSRLEQAIATPATASDDALADRHEALRRRVRASLAELDVLIETLER